MKIYVANVSYGPEGMSEPLEVFVDLADLDRAKRLVQAAHGTGILIREFDVPGGTPGALNALRNNQILEKFRAGLAPGNPPRTPLDHVLSGDA